MIARALLLLLLAPQFVLAAPSYERPIDLGKLENAQAVFVAIPADILSISPLEKLRILHGNTVVPLKTSPIKAGRIEAVLKEISPCSGSASEGFLHDGDSNTTLSPDALKNPSSCIIDISFVAPVEINRVNVETSDALSTLSVAAKDGDKYVLLRESKAATSLTFSSVTTDGIRLTLSYELVPALREITLSGVLPARLLFAAEPGQYYRLMYGDPVPPALPSTPTSLAATSSTVYVSLGQPRMLNEDSDGDGIPAARDNCPGKKNPLQGDSDFDGIGDACDNAPDQPNSPQTDRDLDGIGDARDNCPHIFNPDQLDSDLNEIGDSCDDPDTDGIITIKDNCPLIGNADQKDSDGDGAGDLCQLDRDHDGLPDVADNCRNFANPSQKDSDDDRIGDACDSCPHLRNATQEDRNENGIGDACEGAIQDPDADKVPNSSDNCPHIPNPNQHDRDKDGIGDACDNCPTIQNADQSDENRDRQGDACTDADGDNIFPPLDNCPTIANPMQDDKDNNGKGDACEDDDGDRIVNALDNCRYMPNQDQQDQDADKSGDPCDLEDDRFSEQNPWVMWIGMSILVFVLLSFSIRMIMRIRKDGE